jgi:hypothetical protein
MRRSCFRVRRSQEVGPSPFPLSLTLLSHAKPDKIQLRRLLLEGLRMLAECTTLACDAAASNADAVRDAASLAVETMLVLCNQEFASNVRGQARAAVVQHYGDVLKPLTELKVWFRLGSHAEPAAQGWAGAGREQHFGLLVPHGAHARHWWLRRARSHCAPPSTTRAGSSLLSPLKDPTFAVHSTPLLPQGSHHPHPSPACTYRRLLMEHIVEVSQPLLTRMAAAAEPAGCVVLTTLTAGPRTSCSGSCSAASSQTTSSSFSAVCFLLSFLSFLTTLTEF